MKTTLIVIIAVIFCLTSVAAKASAAGEELILIEAGKGLLGLFDGIFTSGSKSPKEKYTSAEEIEKNTQAVREDVVKRAKELLGIQLTCDTFYDGIKVSPRIMVLTFNGTKNGAPTLISVFFTSDTDNAKKISYEGLFVIWDDLAEYKANSSKKSLAADYAKYYKTDLGPVDEEDPKKTASAESKPETPAQTAIAPAPTVPVQPQTPPTVATAPEPPTQKVVAPDAPAKNPSEVLKELKKMKDDGLITPEEYDAKKKEILGKM